MGAICSLLFLLYPHFNSMSTVKSTNITVHSGNLTREERWNVLSVKGATLWFTGFSGSGKSTVASAVEQELATRKVFTYRLDGDNVRFGLNRDLGFSPEDRKENIRRIGEVAKLFADSGCVTMASFISPYAADRDDARKVHEDAGLPFCEVFVDTPIEECEKRDPKALYKKVRAGEIKNFTGIDAPYEVPKNPELVLHTKGRTVAESAEEVLKFLAEKGIISADII